MSDKYYNMMSFGIRSTSFRAGAMFSLVSSLVLLTVELVLAYYGVLMCGKCNSTTPCITVLSISISRSEEEEEEKDE